jgi:hypothetical protein
VNLKGSLDPDITSNLTQPQSFSLRYLQNAFSKVKGVEGPAAIIFSGLMRIC